MKILVLLMSVLAPGLAHADNFTCELTSLSSGTLLRSFKIRAPLESRILTKLPGNSLQLMTWTYENSIGIQIENLANHDIELSTQMTFTTSTGIFDLVYSAGDIRLTCESEE